MEIYVGMRSVGVLEDVLILLLPMKFVHDLKLPVREKVGLCFIFGLGALYAPHNPERASHQEKKF